MVGVSFPNYTQIPSRLPLIELTSIGRFERTGPDDEVIALEGDAGTKYRKLVISDGRIIGAILLGHARAVTPVRAAITQGADVTSHLDELRAGRWGVLESLE
jgi:nitrite reductase (NADH) large subunit